MAVTCTLFACGDDDNAPASPAADGGGLPDSASTTDGGGGDTGTGNDAGTDSGGTTIGAGPYALVYTGFTVGVDGRAVADGKATFDGFTLTGYAATGQEDEEKPEIGSNTAKEVAGGPLFAIGRWSGGTTGGKFYASNTFPIAENGGFHYGIGIPPSTLPSSGMTTYSIASKTAATVNGGATAPGTVTGALALNLDGDATKIGLSITLDIPGSGTYTAETTGGTADPSQSDADLISGGGSAPKGSFFFNRTNIANAGTACTGGTCALGVSGAIIGPNAEIVLVAAHFYSGSGGTPTSVSGVIAFKK